MKLEAQCKVSQEQGKKEEKKEELFP